MRPADDKTRRALTVHMSTGPLPKMVVTASTDNSGLASAIKMAAASSMPGSVSIMIRCKFFPEPRLR